MKSESLELFTSFLQLVFSQYEIFRELVINNKYLVKNIEMEKNFKDVFDRMEALINSGKYYHDDCIGKLENKQQILTDIMKDLGTAYDLVILDGKQEICLPDDKTISADIVIQHFTQIPEMHDTLSKLLLLNYDPSFEKGELPVSFSSILDLVYNEFNRFRWMITKNCSNHSVINQTYDDIYCQMKALVNLQKYYSRQLPDDTIDKSKVSQILETLVSTTWIAQGKVAFDSQSPNHFSLFEKNIKTISKLASLNIIQ